MSVPFPLPFFLFRVIRVFRGSLRPPSSPIRLRALRVSVVNPQLGELGCGSAALCTSADNFPVLESAADKHFDRS